MDYTPLFVVGAGLFRSTVGWLKSSLTDGQINEFEWRQLIETTIRVGLIGLVVAYFPGFDLSGFETAIVAIGGDLILNAIKKLKKK